jgi:uncharacterized membrane protein YqjE
VECPKDGPSLELRHGLASMVMVWTIVMALVLPDLWARYRHPSVSSSTPVILAVGLLATAWFRSFSDARRFGRPALLGSL